MTACTSNIPSSEATQHAPFGQKQQTRSSCVSKAKCLATSFRLPTKIKGKQKFTKTCSQSKNWLHTQRRRRRNSCHPSKLLRWASLWATFGHSLAPPPTHTHRERALYPLYPTSTLYLYSLYLSIPLPTHTEIYHTKSALNPVYLTTFNL